MSTARFRGITAENYHSFGGEARDQSDFTADNIGTILFLRSYGAEILTQGRRLPDSRYIRFMSVAELRRNAMMSHLLDALAQGEDIGHYGRLVLVMVARYFLPEDYLLKQLQADPDMDEDKARALIEQLVSKGYSPPSREKVLEFQKHQQFPICP